MDNHLDEKLDCIADMLRCMYYKRPNSEFSTICDRYVKIMVKLREKQNGT